MSDDTGSRGPGSCGPLAARLIGALTALALVAGCSGGAETPSFNLQLLQAGQEAIASRFAPEPERPVITRAVLDTLDGAFMEATLEENDQLAYMFVSAVRRDSGPGYVVIWRTEDNVTLALRNDVVIESRGMGGDLMSLQAEIRETVSGPAASGARRHVVRALDNKTVTLNLACDLVDLGPATIEIVGQTHATRHLQERCAGAGGTITNEYWVDSRAGLVWQSRQWVSPDVGYVRLRRLTIG